MSVFTINEGSLDFFFLKEQVPDGKSESCNTHPWLTLPINKEQQILPTPQLARMGFSSERWLWEALNRLGISDFEKLWQEVKETPDEARLGDLKNSIKNELKRYDEEFAEFHGREPESGEKEVLRPLFNFYKKLRQIKGDRSGSEAVEELDENRLKALLEEKETLRHKLNEYKANFQKTTGRKFKEKNDLAPIEQDYKRYKHIKGLIARLSAVKYQD